MARQQDLQVPQCRAADGVPPFELLARLDAVDQRAIRDLIDREGPAWLVRHARPGKSLPKLVACGLVHEWADAETGDRWIVLTQLAADLFHRVPDPTGGLKDPLVGIVDGVSHGKRESVEDWYRKAIQRAHETRAEEAAKEAKSKSRRKPLKGGGTRSGSIL